MGRPTPNWTPAQERMLADRYPHEGASESLASDLGRTRSCLPKKAKQLGLSYKGFEVAQPPSANREVGELLQALEAEYDRKAAHHEGKGDITITRNDSGPFAVAFFGDPHIGDPGTSIRRLRADMDLFKGRSDVLCINIGDITNNWIGSLERLYGVQAITKDEEKRVGRWLIGYIPWALVLLGNHDMWQPIAQDWCNDAGVVYASHGAKVRIMTPGNDPVRVDCRHDHPGRSQFDPAFAQRKSIYRGNRAEIVVAGHIHTSGSGVVANGVAESIGHSIRVGSYKEYDEYADAKGFAPDHVGPCVLCVVDPSLPEYSPGRIVPFWDLERGLIYLEALQERGEK